MLEKKKDQIINAVQTIKVDLRLKKKNFTNSQIKVCNEF